MDTMYQQIEVASSAAVVSDISDEPAPSPVGLRQDGDQVYLQFNEAGNATIEVFNLLGQNVLPRVVKDGVQAPETIQVDMSALAEGVYFVKVDLDQERTTYKVIVSQ